MNMFSYGIDPLLDFEDMPRIRATYERLTRMQVGDRAPYAGNLVFSHFSGSHQDAIAKVWRGEKRRSLRPGPFRTCRSIRWMSEELTTAMLSVSTASLEKAVSDSFWQKTYGIRIPTKMREEVGYSVKDVSDHTHKELQPKEVLKVFNAKIC